MCNKKDKQRADKKTRRKGQVIKRREARQQRSKEQN
jgi:hypothetical protein